MGNIFISWKYHIKNKSTCSPGIDKTVYKISRANNSALMPKITESYFFMRSFWWCFAQATLISQQIEFVTFNLIQHKGYEENRRGIPGEGMRVGDEMEKREGTGTDNRTNKLFNAYINATLLWTEEMFTLYYLKWEKRGKNVSSKDPF